MDKDINGRGNRCVLLYPNKPKYGLLNLAEETENKKTSSDRILAENFPVGSLFFGR